MSRPRLSVVIPAYEAEEFLAEAIESVLAARAVEEIAVVDDGSTDHTAQVAGRYAQRLRLLRQDHRGANAARNLGLAATSGPLVLFLDADDLLRPESVPRLIRVFEDPDVACAYGDFEPSWKRADGRWEAGPICVPEEPGDPLAAILSGWFPPPNLMFRRAALERVGRWNESLLTLTDRELLARISAEGLRLRHAPGLTLHHRDHGNTRLSRDTPARMSIALELLERYRGRFDREGLWTPTRRRLLATEYYRIALSQFRQGDREGAWRTLEILFRVDREFRPAGAGAIVFRALGASSHAKAAVALAGLRSKVARSAPAASLRRLLRRTGLKAAPRVPIWQTNPPAQS